MKLTIIYREKKSLSAKEWQIKGVESGYVQSMVSVTLYSMAL